MGAFATSNPTGSSDVTGSGTANQVSVWASASSLTVGSIPFTSSATGYTIGSLVAEPGGILTLTSTTQGFIPPRLSTAQKDAINPAVLVDGMMLYDSDLRVLTFYNGSDWSPVYGNAWISGGNTFGVATALGNADNFGFSIITNGTERWRYSASGNYSNNLADGTAYIHLAAGTTTASTAPLKFTTGEVLATPEAGAWEFVTDTLYFTITTGAARKTIAFLDGGQTFTSATWNGTAIGAVYGGTGQTTVTTGDLLYGSAANTWSKLASGATAGMFLRNGGASTAPSWSTLILPNSATVNQIVYASATNTYGGSSTFLFNGTSLYVGTASLLGSGDVANFYRNQNGASYLRVTNNTSGTGGQAGVAISANNGSTSGLIAASSAGYTTSGLSIANTFCIITNLSAGMAIGTLSATPIILGTNNAENWRIASGGYLSNTGTTGTAYFHLKAGTATASTAPLKFTLGTSLTVAEAGACEYDGTKFFATNSTAVRGTVNETRINSSSAATLTLAYTYTAYVFTGTTTTWTLPAVAGSTNSIFYIKNIGSGAITLNSDSGSTIYTSSAVNTLTVNPGEAYMLLGNGTYFLVQ